MTLNVQVKVKASMGHIVVHQKELLLVPTIPKKLNKIAVTETTKNDDLGHKLLHPLLGLWRYTLNGNCLLGMGKQFFEDTPKASFTQKHLVLESTSGST